MSGEVSASNRRILVVDDDESTHQSFRKILTPPRRFPTLAALDADLFGKRSLPHAAGFQVDSAYQGEEGLALVRRARSETQPYAMAFVDVRMPPGWDGVKTVQELWREDERLQAVICSAYSDYSWSDIVTALGQTDRLLVLKKPFDVVEVRQMAWAVTEKWNLQKQLADRMAELLSSEQRFKAMIDGSSTIIYLKDAQGRYLLANRNLAKLLKVEPEWLLGKRDAEVFPPEVAAAFRANDLEVLTKNAAIEFEETLPYPGGPRAYLSLKFPLRDEAGAPCAVGGISTDITHRKRAEKGLALLAAASRELAKSLDPREMAGTVAQLGIRAQSSACLLFLTGVSSDDPRRPAPRFTVAHEDSVRGRLLNDVFDRAGPGTPLEKHLLGVLESGRTERSSLPADLLEIAKPSETPEALALEEMARSSSVTVPLSARGAPLGTLTFFARPGSRYLERDVALAEDLAQGCASALENARLYAGARSSARAHEDFITVASHELQRPLTPLMLRVQYARRLHRAGKLASAPREKLDAMLESSERQVSRLSALVKDLLDATRLASGALPVNRQNVDLAQLTRDLVDLFRPEFERGACELRLEADHPVLGRWDALLLERLVSNLLSNALTYCPGRPIEVSVSDEDTHARISVRGLGVGMSEEDQARLLEAPRAAHGGTRGLGLFIARRIATAHGGTITVESRPGAESTFSVLLPRGTRP